MGILLVAVATAMWINRPELIVRPYLTEQPQIGDVVMVSLPYKRAPKSSIETVAIGPGGTFTAANGKQLVIPAHYYAMVTSDGRPRIVPAKYIRGKVQSLR